MKSLLLALALAAVCFGSLDIEFRQWAAKHNKVYTASEFSRRLAIYEANIKEIARLNALNGDDAHYAPNMFADLSREEFRNIYLGHRARQFTGPVAKPSNGAELPVAWDWRDAVPARVNPVQNQGSCGSCWSFSATAYMEGFDSKTNAIKKLSEQQVVDCDTNCYIPTDCDKGCDGGWMVTAMRYAVEAGGLELTEDYPYTARTGRCKFDKTKIAAKIAGTPVVLPVGDEEALRARVYEDGPVSIAINADLLSFYSSGIIGNTTECPHDTIANLNHALVIVGWGRKRGSDLEYWIIRNSWGAAWGEKGYFRMQIGSNICGVADMASAIDM